MNFLKQCSGGMMSRIKTLLLLILSSPFIPMWCYVYWNKNTQKKKKTFIAIIWTDLEGANSAEGLKFVPCFRFGKGWVTWYSVDGVTANTSLLYFDPYWLSAPLPIFPIIFLNLRFKLLSGFKRRKQYGTIFVPSSPPKYNK